MCNCGGGGGQAPIPRIRQSIVALTPTPQDNCPYTVDMITDWLNRTECFKNNGYYVGTSITVRQLNIYLGTLKSALNNATNICYFQSMLDNVRSFIMYLSTTDKCSSSS